MSCISHCVEKLAEMVTTFPQVDLYECIQDLRGIKQQADLKKNHILLHVKRNLFIPVDLHDFFNILSVQHQIGNQVDEVAAFLSFLTREESSSLGTFSLELKELLRKSIDVFLGARKIIQCIDDLLEASFGGVEAKKVNLLINQVVNKAVEVRDFARSLMGNYVGVNSLSTFYVKIKIIEGVNRISEFSADLAAHILILLEL